MPIDNCDAQETINLFLVALTAVGVLLQQVFSYFRHKHILADNQRLLRVIEEPGYIEQKQK